MKKIIDKIINCLKRLMRKNKSKIKPPTLLNINKAEYKCYIEAQHKYPDYLKLSEDLIYYSYFLIQSHAPGFLISSMLYAPIPKALSLVILSIIRQHSYQAHFNLRIVIEFLSLMLYAFDNPDADSFGKFKTENNFQHDDKIVGRAGKAMQEKYGKDIERLKGLKDSINKTHAHANINNAKYNFVIKNEGQIVETHFFDQLEDVEIEVGLMGTNLCIINVFELIALVSKNYDAIVLKDTFDKDIANFKQRFSDLENKLFEERKEYFETRLEDEE